MAAAAMDSMVKVPPHTSMSLLGMWPVYPGMANILEATALPRSALRRVPLVTLFRDSCADKGRPDTLFRLPLAPREGHDNVPATAPSRELGLSLEDREDRVTSKKDPACVCAKGFTDETDVAADGDTLHHSTVPKEGRFMASPLAVARRCQTGFLS